MSEGEIRTGEARMDGIEKRSAEWEVAALAGVVGGVAGSATTAIINVVVAKIGGEKDNKPKQ